MITVKLQGGLGNQMFQYALGRALALKNHDSLSLDVNFYIHKNLDVKRVYGLDIFNIKAEIAEMSRKHFINKLFKSRKEKSFSFNEKILSIGSDAYLDGYWQSPKYFAGYEDIIRGDFTLKNPLDLNIQELASEISDTNSLCIHVRRGDYVGNTYHEVVNNEYYKKGIEHITQKTKIDKIYVFSDDIEWCKNNLFFKIPVMFVGDEYKGSKDEWHMHLMSKCKNFIIANSSFSWWAAWLSGNKDKIVVCPKQWFGDATIDTSDLIPKEWIRT